MEQYYLVMVPYMSVLALNLGLKYSEGYGYDTLIVLIITVFPYFTHMRIDILCKLGANPIKSQVKILVMCSTINSNGSTAG